MWKFNNFPTTFILREIKFMKSLTYLHTCMAWILHPRICVIRFKAYEIAKMAVAGLLHSPKLISRKIWVQTNPQISTLGMYSRFQTYLYCPLKSVSNFELSAFSSYFTDPVPLSNYFYFQEKSANNMNEKDEVKFKSI